MVRRLFGILAGSAAVATLLSGCTGGSPSAETSTSSTPPPGVAGSHLRPVLRVSGPRDSSFSYCYNTRGRRDVAVFELSVKADEPVTIDDITLLDPVRVRTPFRDALTVPPASPGAPVRFLGSADWPARDSLFPNKLAWALRDSLDGHHYETGETGLLVLHVVARPGGSFNGIEVHSSPDAGGMETASIQVAFSFERHCS